MGFIVFIVAPLVLVYVFYKFFPRNIVNITPALGKWSVITGATDGIGKSFSHELAGKGFNVVLVSRSVDKLEAAAKEIEKKFNVLTKIIQADFTSLDVQMYAKIDADLKDLEIGVLVNNVGMTSPHPEYFLELEKHHSNVYQDILNCNIISAVNMTRFVLPGMVTRGKGLIINISSGLSKFPSPLHTLYGATKSFITKFSQDLNTEYSNMGVHVHVLTTGLVATKLSGAKERSFFPPSPETYVKSALEDVTRMTCCDGYVAHTMMSVVAGIGKILCPTYLGTLVLKRFIRAKAIQITKCKECRNEFHE